MTRKVWVILLAVIASALVAGVALASPPGTPAPDAGSVQVSDVTLQPIATLAQTIAGPGVPISNISYTGSDRAAGTFTNGTNSIGFESGVVLGTGYVQTKAGDPACSQGVEGPNTCNDTVAPPDNTDSTILGTAGDPDLTKLAGQQTNDAAVLQFDFVPSTSQINIDYVFSSEEYDDFVQSGFNDVFGFFVNGTNCAMVPGTGQPVSVNTINDGSDNNPNIQPSNPQFFRDNVPGRYGPSGAIDSQMDGLTTVLTCTANVNAGQTNHVKLAIADSGDRTVNSAVFIQAGTLTTGIGATGGRTFSGLPPLNVNGSLATLTDTTPGRTAADYSATVNWGDGTSSAGTVSGQGGTFSVSGGHTYSQRGDYTITVAISDSAGDHASATDSVLVGVSGVPTVEQSSPSVGPAGTATFSGNVTPNGSDTVGYFEYALDPSYIDSPNATLEFDESTPNVSLGSGRTPQPISASVSGLLPNALYHVRLVALNGYGMTTGPDFTFMTSSNPLPGPPKLGKTVNLYPVSGIAFVRGPHGRSLATDLRVRTNQLSSKGHGFIPLTEARQLPVGSQIDTRRGTVKVVAATTHRGRVQSATFFGPLWSVNQARRGFHKGLTTLKLLENLFSGAPSYASCRKAKKTKKATATAAGGPSASAAARSRILQTLHARDRHGKWSSRGCCSAATVRGTQWTMEDRCNGTWTHVRRGVVSVRDFRRRRTVILHAGQSYLARAIRHRRH